MSQSTTLIDAIPSLTARQLFEQLVKPSLTGCTDDKPDLCHNGKGGTCGVCHYTDGGVGPGFLVSAVPDKYDPYDTVIGWTNFVVPDPTLSNLLQKGNHEGPALSQSQYDLVLSWLLQEKRERDAQTFKPFQPQVPPFLPQLTPSGGTKVINKVYLDQISTKFTGAYLRFVATPVGTSGGLEISDLRIVNTKDNVQAMEQRTIHMNHPLWVVWINGIAHPDPVDSFFGLDKTVTLNQELPNGSLIVPGLVTLSDWRNGAALSVVFDTLEVVGSLVPPNPCKPAGLTVFNQLAANYLSKPMSCTQSGRCHNAVSQAAGIDMSPTLMAGADLSGLCQTLKFYNTANIIKMNTDPANVNNHPYKWNSAGCTANGLPATCFTDFSTVLSQWAAAEQ